MKIKDFLKQITDLYRTYGDVGELELLSVYQTIGRITLGEFDDYEDEEPYFLLEDY